MTEESKKRESRNRNVRSDRSEQTVHKTAGQPPPTELPQPKRPEIWWTETLEPNPASYGPPIDRPPDPLWRVGLLVELQELQHQVWRELTQHGLIAGGVQALKKLAATLSPRRFWKLWAELALVYRSPHVDRFGFDPRFFELVEPLLDFFYSRYFRVDTLGVSNIPSHGKALMVANHSGTLPVDGAMLLYAVRRDHRAHRQVRVLVEDFVFHFPFVGSVINRIGGVRACQENAESLLDAGQLAAVFPEGVQGIGKLFSERYKLQRFGRGGFVKLALRTRAPIIPVSIVGAEEIYPMLARLDWLSRSLEIPYVPITPLFPLLGPLGLLPLPTKWFIRFGEPIRLHEQYGPEAVGDRLLINKLSEGIRSTIQVMVDATLRERKSVFGS